MTTTFEKSIENFNLKFGKYKGQDFLSTPKSYQDWLLAQDWFKIPTTINTLTKSNEARYDVVRKFVKEYAIGMGRSKERVMYDLSWDEAEAHKNNMNMYQLDDCTEYFYIESAI
jgi:uncharacterized protein (DUF3820 family)